MAWDLAAGIVAAIAAGGMVLFLRRVLRVPLPKWAMPAAAGAAMVAYAMWSEYSWFGRMTTALPPSVEVAVTSESRAPWRPWTYLLPITTRFVAFDRAAIRTHPAVPAEKIVTLMRFGRWERAQAVPVLYDCAGGRQAMLADAATFGPDGAVAGADWRPVAADDPVLPKVCAGG